jgi:hypothetical protein
MVTNHSVIKAQEGIIGVLAKSKGTVKVGGSGLTPESSLLNTSLANLNLSLSNHVEDKKGMAAGKYRISKWGYDNLFPNHLMRLYENNIFNGLADFKVDMLYSLGYQLYEWKIVGNEKVKVPVYDSEINDWLEGWDAPGFIIDAFTDFVWIENIFTQIVVNKAKKKIVSLHHMNTEECRLEIMDDKGKFKNVILSDWTGFNREYKSIPAMDWIKPLVKQNTFVNMKKKSFGLRIYNFPVYIGMIKKWIPLANEIPAFHLNRLQKSINAKYHIKIPISSLRALRDLKQWHQEDLDKWLEAKLKEIDDMLAGVENAGKAFYSYKDTDMNGKEMTGWEINLIDNNEKQQSEANLQLFNETNQAITSAMQVQPSLASIQLGNNMSSGSEVLNSYNMHIKTRTRIARTMVLDTINRSIRVNWPEKRFFIDMVDAVWDKEEDDNNSITNEPPLPVIIPAKGFRRAPRKFPVWKPVWYPNNIG